MYLIRFTLWWRIIFFQITTSATCLTDYDCFITDTSKLIGFPIYEQCNNLSEKFSNNMSYICIQFTIPSLDDLYTTVGVSYGLTAVVFSILRFIMALNVSAKFSKIILIASSLLFFGVVVLLILLISFISSFTSWLKNSFVNYLVPFLILISIFIAIGLFCVLNIRLEKIQNYNHDQNFKIKYSISPSNHIKKSAISKTKLKF